MVTAGSPAHGLGRPRQTSQSDRVVALAGVPAPRSTRPTDHLAALGKLAGGRFLVTNEEFAALALTRQEFHGEWNYTLMPRSSPV